MKNDISTEMLEQTMIISILSSVGERVKTNLTNGKFNWSRIYKVEMDQPKRRSAQQARHKKLRFAYGAASARLRPAS